MTDYKKFKNKGVHITPLDAHPHDFNRDTMLEWLANTGWVDNLIRKKMGASPYVEDYIQEIWLQIIHYADKLTYIFLYEGKGKFINYIKMMITNNCISTSSPAYCHIRGKEKYEVHLSDVGWQILDETYEEGELYKNGEITAKNPNDDYYE